MYESLIFLTPTPTLFSRGLSAIRYRIHLNLCAALAAAQLIFVTGIDATEIKVSEHLKLCFPDKTNSWTAVKPTKEKKMMKKGEEHFLLILHLKFKRHDISRLPFRVHCRH